MPTMDRKKVTKKKVKSAAVLPLATIGARTMIEPIHGECYVARQDVEGMLRKLLRAKTPERRRAIIVAYNDAVNSTI